MFTNTMFERGVNPRLAVEIAILHFDPNISSRELLDLREKIIYDTFHAEEKAGYIGMYVRDSYLYTRKCYA